MAKFKNQIGGKLALKMQQSKKGIVKKVATYAVSSKEYLGLRNTNYGLLDLPLYKTY
jgi:hypothetical protein